jgi:hypothetical protein
MIQLSSSILIERPVSRVFDFVSTPENDFQWRYGTLATVTLPKAGSSVRTFFRSIGHLMGRRNLSTFEVTELVPDKKYSYRSLSGPLHYSTSYLFDEAGGRTRMDISIQVSAPDFFHITEKLLGHTMKEQLLEDGASLKKYLEADAAGL